MKKFSLALFSHCLGEGTALNQVGWGPVERSACR